MHQWMKLAGLCLLLLCGMASASEVFVTYYHNDHLGSPVAATDESGNLLWREHYRPFGERQDSPGYQGYGTIGFTGHAQSQDSGLVYAGARYYDPLIGRFLSVDPKEASEEAPGSFNRYAYSLNNPYGYSDPDGRWVAAALGVLDAGLTIHGIHSEYRSGGMEAAQAEVGKAVAAHLVGGLAGNVLRRGYILAKEGSIAAKAIDNSVIGKPRVGSANKLPDGQHGFNDIIDNYAGDAAKFEIPTKGPGGGVVRMSELRQIEGGSNGVSGVFEWIVDGGNVTHRRFIPGGKITGLPNQFPKK